MRRELDGDVEVPKNQMATPGSVELAEARDRTPAKAQVLEIFVWNGTNTRAKVECHGAKCCILEWSPKLRIPLLQLSQPCFAERMQVGRVVRENGYHVI